MFLRPCDRLPHGKRRQAVPSLACSSVGPGSSADGLEHLGCLLQDGNQRGRWGGFSSGGSGGEKKSVFNQIDLFYILALICFIYRHFSSKLMISFLLFNLKVNSRTAGPF